MELEAEDELINMEGDAAPYAMYEAHRERQEWENGGAAPVVEDPAYAVRQRHCTNIEASHVSPRVE
jgi:hypothetical protein